MVCGQCPPYGTDKEKVLDWRGWEWLKNIPRTKYGEIDVVT
jgi:Holliday junction resolvase-like predicted endonuclease